MAIIQNQGTKGPIGMKANSAVMLNVEQSRGQSSTDRYLIQFREVCDEEEAAVMGAQAGQCGRRAQPASLVSESRIWVLDDQRRGCRSVFW